MILSEVQYKEYHDMVHYFITKYCIIKQNGMPGKIPGTVYNWMFYLRNGLFNPDFLHCVSEMMLYRIHQEIGDFNFQICGAETAGTPLAAAIPLVAKAHKIPMSGYVIRKDQKEYGLKNWHEGMAFKQVPYVLVDDLCNSSTSLAHADHICKTGLGLVSGNLAIVIVNKVNKEVHSEERTQTDMYLPKETKVLSLFDLDSFDLSNPSH